MELLHVDDACLVVAKPCGLLSVPGRSVADCMASRVQARFADALVVHRLDMATSGLMLFARGAEAQRQLSRAFAARAVQKAYVAIVHGTPAPAAGSIDLPLAADWPNRPMQKVCGLTGKPSLTHYRVVEGESPEGCSRVELQPVTGRAHQLRVHLQAIGHAILGDALYASPEVQALAPRLMLHAAMLAFAHPVTGQMLRVEHAPPF